MNITQHNDSLQIVNISPEDRELLLTVFEYFTNRWSNTQQMDADILKVDALVVQLEEMASV